MCTPSIPKDNSAEIAQQENAQRQANIKSGQSAIDTAFSQFNDDYFNKFANDYENNYDPQVDEQYQRAQQKERYNFARNGTLNGTPAINQADLLNENYANQRQQVASDANSAVQSEKNAIAQQKSSLYALNESAADPTLATQQAAASAGTIASTPQYSVLGDLFSGLVNAGNAYYTGSQKALPANYAYAINSPSGRLPTGNGSSTVVGG